MYNFLLGYLVRKEKLNIQESVIRKIAPNAASPRILLSLNNIGGCVRHDSVQETETTLYILNRR